MLANSKGKNIIYFPVIICYHDLYAERLLKWITPKITEWFIDVKNAEGDQGFLQPKIFLKLFSVGF